MRHSPLLPPEMLEARPTPWDIALEVLLGLLLVFLALASGGVNAWSELPVLALAALMSLLVAARALLVRDFRLAWTWAYVPLAVFIGLTVLQITPLPAAALARVSPASMATRAQLLGEAPASATISMYPHATSHMLRLVLLGSAVFFAVATTVRTPEQVRRLLLILFGVGVAQAVLALLQIFTGADRILWNLDVGSARLTSGSFINYSNFSQFMNLCLGAGLGLLLIRLYERRPSEGRSFSSSGFGDSLSDHAPLIAGIVIAAVSVFTSLSRNGAISLVVAGFIVGTALFARGTLSRRGWVLAVLPFGALALLLMFGVDAVYERLATLDDDDPLNGRWDMILGGFRAWREYPVMGIGLGAHEVVFPMFDTAVTPSIAEHADNDYIELLEETGMLGVAAVGAFLAIVGAALCRVCRRGHGPTSIAAFGMAFGLLAVAIHSATDFGQHVPAVFCLSATMCGLAIALWRMERDPAVVTAQNARPVRRLAAAAMSLALIATWTWALRGAHAAYVAEQWWAAALDVEERIDYAGAAATDEQFGDLIAAAQQAATAEPGNVTYSYWLNVYRWRSLARYLTAGTSSGDLPAETAAVVARIAEELRSTRQLAPTFGPPYALEGELRLFMLAQESGRQLIQQGVRLAGYDAPTYYIAGELAARDGKSEEAVRLLTRAVALSPTFFDNAAAILLLDLKQPELARSLAGADQGHLLRLAQLAAAHPEYAALAVELREQAETGLRARADADDASAGELAGLAAADASRGNAASAAELYRRALKLDYNQVEWRFALAKVLTELGDTAQAMREARICLRLSPNHAGARQLAEELSLVAE